MDNNAFTVKCFINRTELYLPSFGKVKHHVQKVKFNDKFNHVWSTFEMDSPPVHVAT